MSSENRDGFLTVTDGISLHYRDYPGSGERPPILCLPGSPGMPRLRRLRRAFSPRFRVIALDFRGRGESDFDPEPARYNPLTYAGDVQQLLDQLGIGQAIFVGTSLGGLVTMILAATAPQRIAAAILNDVGPELEPGRARPDQDLSSARTCASKAGTKRRPRLPPTTASFRPATRKRIG